MGFQDEFRDPPKEVWDRVRREMCVGLKCLGAWGRVYNPVGVGICGVPQPRVALRLPWALSFNPVGVKIGGGPF